jgi:hypothetical protein
VQLHWGPCGHKNNEPSGWWKAWSFLTNPVTSWFSKILLRGISWNYDKWRKIVKFNDVIFFVPYTSNRQGQIFSSALLYEILITLLISCHSSHEINMLSEGANLSFDSVGTTAVYEWGPCLHAYA